MSLRAKAYIGLVIALGFLTLCLGLYHWQPRDLVRFFCYLALAIPASCLKVALPRVTGTMSVLFVFLLAAIAELGLPETLVIGVLCVIVQSIWHSRRKPQLVQVSFSVATIVLAVASTYFVYRAVPFLSTPLRLTIAATVIFIVNTLPIAIVISLTEGKALRQVWNNCYLWCFPYHLVGAAIVGGFRSFENRMLDWQAWILIVPVIFVLYRSYQLYLSQLQAERNRAEDQRVHAEEVAALHAKTVEALASSVHANSKLDAVIRASPLAIVALDREGNVTGWNVMAEQIFGWGSEEVTGRLLPFATGKSEETVRNMISRTLRGESISSVEMKQLRKDGSPFDAAIWTAPLREEEGITGVLITATDVSGRKRLEEQLLLSQKMEAVGRLAGGVAHDFNNLLTIINGYSSLLIDTVSGHKYAVSQAEEILGAGTRAAELVSQLLTFSRRQLVKPKPLEINQFVREVSRMMERIIGEHIDCRLELDPDAGWIHADLNQMEGVVLNLATNARDAMPDGGVLTIRTARTGAPGDLPADGGDDGSYVCLIVTDTGHGMDSETQQRLFEPFFTTKQQGKGTGLGLSSVYGSVEQNRGRIQVSSELGRGTSFSLYFPAIECPVSPESGPEISRKLAAGTETILLVEDQDAVRQLLRAVLSKAGYRVLEASNGAEAIAQWAGQIDRIDLVVTDIVMPIMNGLRLAEELRKRRQDIRIICMSGHSEDVVDRRSGLNPVPDLLQKPFVPEALVRKVRETLDQPSARNRSFPEASRVNKSVTKSRDR